MALLLTGGGGVRLDAQRQIPLPRAALGRQNSALREKVRRLEVSNESLDDERVQLMEETENLREIRRNPEAQARLEHIPLAFLRDKVKQGLEAFAQRQGLDLITADVMKQALAGDERSEKFGKMPGFSKPD